MHHGQEHGPFDGELESATAEERFEHLRDAQFLPEPAEDQRRPESHGVPGLDVVLPGRVENGGVFGELGTGGEEGIELVHVIGPKTAHAIHPQSKIEVEQRMKSLAK